MKVKLKTKLEKNQIYHGDSLKILKTLPSNSIDLVFADPPYNLQLKNKLLRPDSSEVDAVNDNWDQFDCFNNFDDFTINWLSEVKRITKNDGSIWVIVLIITFLE